MTSRKKAAKSVQRLELSGEDRAALKVLARKPVKSRVWRRVRILQLLDQGWTMADAATAAGTYPREVRRIRQRFLAGGLFEALGEDARPRPARLLDARQEAAIVAMVCAPPPPGRAEWSTALIAQEASRRGIVAKVSPPVTVGTKITDITEHQGPTRWRGGRALPGNLPRPPASPARQRGAARAGLVVHPPGRG